MLSKTGLYTINIFTAPSKIRDLSSLDVILIVRELLRGTLPRRRVKNILGAGYVGDMIYGFDTTLQ